MPKEVQEQIDTQRSLGLLVLYDDFMGFIKTIATSSKYRAMDPVKQLTAAVL